MVASPFSNVAFAVYWPEVVLPFCVVADISEWPWAGSHFCKRPNVGLARFVERSPFDGDERNSDRDKDDQGKKNRTEDDAEVFHMRICGLTRHKLSRPSASADGYLWKYFNHESGRKQAG